MGCGFSNEKPESNLRNKDIINILDDTQRFNDNEEHVLSDMGTSQSKRSNKISKLRTSSVGTVGDSEENKGNGNSSSSGKLFSIKGNTIKNNEINKKDGSNNGSTFLQTNSDVSSSQVNFFKMLDEKIENGDDFDEEEADRMRQIEFLKCKEEWDHVLSKSQNNNKQQQLLVESSLNKPSLQSSITPSDHSSSSEITKTSKNSFKQTSISDSQKKQHCDEQPHKLSRDNERSKRNNPTTSSSSTSGNTSRSKETKKIAKENGGAFSSSNNTSNSINLMSENKDDNGRKEGKDILNSKSVEINSSKKSTSLRKPKLKPKESENNTSSNSNNGSTNITASRKDSTNDRKDTARHDPQKSTITKASTTKAIESSTSSQPVIPNGSSKTDVVMENLDTTGKRKSTVTPSTSSSSKHLKDRGKKMN